MKHLGAANVASHPVSTVTATVAVLALALTGCSGNDADPDSGTVTNSPGTSTTPDTSNGRTHSTNDDSQSTGNEYVPASADGPAQNVPEPEFTTKTQELTEEDAEAALRHWIKVVDYLRRTGDPTLFDDISSSDCPNCVDIRNSFTEIYEQGLWLHAGTDTAESGETQVEVIETRIHEDEDMAEFVVSLSEPPVTVYQSDGTVDEDLSVDDRHQEDSYITLVLDPRYRKWEVTEFVSLGDE